MGSVSFDHHGDFTSVLFFALPGIDGQARMQNIDAGSKLLCDK